LHGARQISVLAGNEDPSVATGLGTATIGTIVDGVTATGAGAGRP
jgi:hypothetical protein